MSTCEAQPGAAQRWPARPRLPQPVLLRPGQKPLLCSAFKEMLVPRCCSCGVGARRLGRQSCGHAALSAGSSGTVATAPDRGLLF